MLGVAITLVLGGCDLIEATFDPGGPLYAGVVVEAETGEPLEDIHVSLQTIMGYGGRTVVAEDLTDADGRFRLRDPKDRATQAAFFVNSPGNIGESPSPYNPLYHGGNYYYDPEDRQNIRIELQRVP